MVVDGLEDMQVPVMDSDNRAGNFVAVDCGEFVVILAHLRRDSIVVAAGDGVQVGDALGGEPLWLTIDGQFPVRNDRMHVD